MKDFVEQRLLAILTSPDGWGPPQAVELQVLLLIEMWHVIQGAPSDQVNNTSRRYAQYLGSVLPGPPVDLAHRLELTDERATDQFVAILREFVQREQGSNPP